MEPGAGSTIGIVAERGSVDEGVVLAARTIGALCMRAESIMHFLSSACSKDRPTCLLRYLMTSLSRRAKLGPASTPFATGKNCDAARDCVTGYFGMLYGISGLEKRWIGRDMKVL